MIGQDGVLMQRDTEVTAEILFYLRKHRGKWFTRRELYRDVYGVHVSFERFVRILERLVREKKILGRKATYKECEKYGAWNVRLYSIPELSLEVNRK